MGFKGQDRVPIASPAPYTPLLVQRRVRDCGLGCTAPCTPLPTQRRMRDCACSMYSPARPKKGSQFWIRAQARRAQLHYMPISLLKPPHPPWHRDNFRQKVRAVATACGKDSCGLHSLKTLRLAVSVTVGFSRVGFRKTSLGVYSP